MKRHGFGRQVTRWVTSYPLTWRGFMQSRKDFKGCVNKKYRIKEGYLWINCIENKEYQQPYFPHMSIDRRKK